MSRTVVSSRSQTELRRPTDLDPNAIAWVEYSRVIALKIMERVSVLDAERFWSLVPDGGTAKNDAELAERFLMLLEEQGDFDKALTIAKERDLSVGTRHIFKDYRGNDVLVEVIRYHASADYPGRETYFCRPVGGGLIPVRCGNGWMFQEVISASPDQLRGIDGE